MSFRPSSAPLCALFSFSLFFFSLLALFTNPEGLAFGAADASATEVPARGLRALRAARQAFFLVFPLFSFFFFPFRFSRLHAQCTPADHCFPDEEDNSDDDEALLHALVVDQARPGPSDPSSLRQFLTAARGPERNSVRLLCQVHGEASRACK